MYQRKKKETGIDVCVCVCVNLFTGYVRDFSESEALCSNEYVFHHVLQACKGL